MKLSVHFVERFVRFVFDALTTDNSTGIRKISQVFDEFTPHNLSGFAIKSTVKKYLLLRIRRQFDIEFASTPDQGGTEFASTPALV
jgi:hypothetical protein